MSLKTLIRTFWGGRDTRALDGTQSDTDARIAQLSREFATHPANGLTPRRLAALLEAAEQGDLKAQHELFDDMEERDPQIAADLAKRRAAAAEREWQIVPPDNASAQEKRATEHAIDVFSGLDVDALIIDMGTGIGHGWAMLELPWARDGAQRYVEQPRFRPHAWFRLHPERQDELRLSDASAEGAELWPLGWVRHQHRAKAGYIARSGLHRVLAWPYLFQHYTLTDLAELLEIYGLPARIGHYPTTASDKEKATLLRAVTSLGHHAAGIIPEGMRIEFLEAAAGQGDLFQVMLRWCEQAKSRAILGGTLTSGTGEGTNTNALGNIHERSLDSLIRSDARQYAATIGRDILWPMAALNYGITDRRRAPRFYLDTGDIEDLKQLADTLPVFVALGAEIPQWWLHEKTRIPRATEGEDVLRPVIDPLPASAPLATQQRGHVPAPAAGPHVQNCTCPGCTGPATAALTADPGDDPQRALDTVQVPGLARQAEALVGPALDALGGLDAGMSPEQALDALATAYPRMDDTALAEALARAMFVAELAGRLEVQRDRG